MLTKYQYIHSRDTNCKLINANDAIQLSPDFSIIRIGDALYYI